MRRTGRADGWRHDREKALTGGGFRGQGRAIRHRGDHRVVCTVSRNQGSQIPDKREREAPQSTAENGGETPPQAVIHGHFNGVGPFI